MGGPEKIDKHHGRGSLTARERIDLLARSGTASARSARWWAATIPSDAFVCGWGRIDGRPVVVGCEDFTVLGGSIGSGSTAKRYRIGRDRDAGAVPAHLDPRRRRSPTGDAGRVAHARSPTDLIVQAQLSGHVPFITAVLGASAGHSAMAVPVADWTVMAANSAVFTAGPPLVKEALGRGDRQAVARRPTGRGHRGHGAQRRQRRRGRAAVDPRLPQLLPVVGVGLRAGARRRIRIAVRGSCPSCSSWFPSTAAGSTTCAKSCRSSSTTASSSRCSPTSAHDRVRARASRRASGRDRRESACRKGWRGRLPTAR